ncbi:hypothetical protein BH10CYA1_BH10CYA1_23930 [soil metagenome]
MLRIKQFFTKDHYSSNWGADLILAFFAFLSCLPIFSNGVMAYPNKCNGDESVHVICVRWAIENTVPLFSTFEYYQHPNLEFYLYGWLINLFSSSINIQTFRIVSATLACVEVACVYLLFRSFKSTRLFALCGIAIFSMNHSYFALQRMAFVNNSALLFMIPAWFLLIEGFRRNSIKLSVAGGIIGGFSFYMFFPSRIFLPIWLLSVSAYSLFNWPLVKSRRNIIAISAIAYVLTCLPLLCHYAEDPGATTASIAYLRLCSNLSNEGLDLEKQWEHQPDRQAAFITNVKQGLTVFNNNISDRGCLYENLTHGFADPVTGIAIWLGLLLHIRRFKNDFGSAVAVTTFLSIYLINAVCINKAPNYTRLLIIWPFAAFFATTALFAAASGATKITKLLLKNFSSVSTAVASRCSTVAGFLVASFLMVCSFSINRLYSEDFQKAAKFDSFHLTAQYMLAHPDADVIAVCYDPKSRYFWYGDKERFRQNIEGYRSAKQRCMSITPEQVSRLPENKNIILLCTETDWKVMKTAFNERYKQVSVEQIDHGAPYFAISSGKD